MKHTIYQEIKKKITSGEISPGTTLVERDICNKFGISRTPIREILWHLTSDGLVKKDASGGYIVRKISIDDIINIFQSREAIEGIAARLACAKGDDQFYSDIKKIKGVLEKIDIEKYPQDGVRYGTKLHDAIIRASNNPFLSEFYKKLRTISVLTRNISQRSVDIEKKSLEFHLAIINALEQRDEEQAEYFVREHLRTTCRLLIDGFFPNPLKKRVLRKTVK